jgi:hypothetical protein
VAKLAEIVPLGGDCDPTLHDDDVALVGGDGIALVVTLVEDVLDADGEGVGVAEGFEGPDEHATKTRDRKAPNPRIARRRTPPLYRENRARASRCCDPHVNR